MPGVKRGGKIRGSYTRNERKIIDPFKEQYKKAETARERQHIAMNLIFKQLFVYWTQNDGAIGTEDAKLRGENLAYWLQNNWRRKKRHQSAGNLLIVKKSDVVYYLKKKEVFEEIALLLGVDEVDTTDKKWFGVRTTAIRNIMDRMTPAELREVDAEVEKIGREGYSIPQKQLNAMKHCTKRFEVSALHHWLEMGVLSVSIAAYLNSSSQHENASELVGIKMYETFQERHREKLQEIKRLWIDYIHEVLDRKNGSFSGPTKDNNVNAPGPVDLLAMKLGYSDDGYPRLPIGLEIDKLKKTPGCALLRNYLAQNYRLATCLQSDQVPYTAISESVLAQNQFIQPKYLPVGFRLADPHNLKVERIRDFFHHIKMRESQYPPSDVFRFQNVHSTRRKGEVVPTKYPGEFDAANPPFVKKKTVRRKKKATATAQTDQLPAFAVPILPESSTSLTQAVDLGSAHPNPTPGTTNEIIAGYGCLPSAVDETSMATPAQILEGYVTTQPHVSSAVNEPSTLKPAETTEDLLLKEMLRFDASFLNVFDETQPYPYAAVGSSHDLGLVFDGALNMSDPTPGMAISTSQNFNSGSFNSTYHDNGMPESYQTPLFDKTFSRIVEDGDSRPAPGQYSPTATPFERATSTGLPTPCLTPDKVHMSRSGSMSNPRSVLLKQQIAGLFPDQPHSSRFLTPELLSPMGTLSPLNQGGLAMPIQAQFNDLRQTTPTVLSPLQNEYGVPNQGHGAMYPMPNGPAYQNECSTPTMPAPHNVNIQRPSQYVYPMATGANFLEPEHSVLTSAQIQIAAQVEHPGVTAGQTQMTAQPDHRVSLPGQTQIPAQPDHPVPLPGQTNFTAQPDDRVSLPGQTQITAQHQVPMTGQMQITPQPVLPTRNVHSVPASAKGHQAARQGQPAVTPQDPSLQQTSSETVRAKRAVLTADARAITEAEIVSGKRKRVPKKRG